MKLKEILIGVVAVVLVALVAVGATLAYLTATDEVTNVMTVGDVELEILEFERVSTDTSGVDAQLQAFRDDKKLIPAIVPAEFDYTKKDATINWDEDKDGKEIKKNYTSAIWDPAKIRSEEDKMVFVKNTGKHTDAYVRLYFAFEAGNYASFEQFQNKIHLNINEQDWTWEWEERLAEIKGMKCFVACATYKKAIAPDELTTISLSQIALDAYATNADSASFGEKYDVLVVGQGIQSGGMGTADEALDKGFGDEIPFAGFRFVDFADLKTALHYLDANTNGTTFVGTGERPNTLLNTVTFGLFEDYYEKVLGHEGVATTNASGDGEFEGYTYYVPNGDKYDLYVLTDSGVIYMPKERNGLFAHMQSLTKVSTDNMDVSQVTAMNSMFRGCSTLEELDVSDWDVSNVTKTAFMFNSCYALQNIDVSNWTVSKVTDMSAMFQDCQTVTALDVSEWNTAGVKNISAMFSGCSNLASIDVSNWTVDNVTGMNSTFKYCPKLASPMNLSGWNVGKVTSMALMFEGCTSLTELNVSGWNVSNATSLRGIFKNCNLLTELEVAGWSVSEKNTSLFETFYGCNNLKSLDLSNWTVSSVTDMMRTFAGCSSLSSLNVSTWDVGAVTTMAEMFSGCSSLASLNVSKWNVNKVTSMTSLFYNCSSLTSLDISKWNVGNVTAMNNMFLTCEGLTELDLSEWNTSKVEHARNMFRGCSELVTIYVGGGWEMSQIPEKNVGASSGEKSSALMFDGCPKLVGEKGTRYNQNNVDKTYAHIDGGASNPGYLTSKNNS